MRKNTLRIAVVCLIIAIALSVYGICYAENVDQNIISLPDQDQYDIETVSIDCSCVAMDQIRIVLVHHGAVPYGNYYSGIFFEVKDLTGKLLYVPYYEARPDILGKPAFIAHDQYEPMHPQIVGPSQFAFGAWENPAFKEVLSHVSCAQLKGIMFTMGYSQKGDWSDYRGARFEFVNGK